VIYIFILFFFFENITKSKQQLEFMIESLVARNEGSSRINAKKTVSRPCRNLFVLANGVPGIRG